MENLQEALSRGSCGLQRTCKESVNEGSDGTKCVKVHKCVCQTSSDLPEEQVLPVCDIKVTRILLNIWVTEFRRAEPETMVGKSTEFDLFV